MTRPVTYLPVKGPSEFDCAHCGMHVVSYPPDEPRALTGGLAKLCAERGLAQPASTCMDCIFQHIRDGGIPVPSEGCG